MEIFLYRAYDANGTIHEGKLQALSVEAAKIKLKDDGLIPVKITKNESSDFNIIEWLKKARKPSSQEIEFFTSKVALLLKNGVKIDQALEIALKGLKSTKFQKIIEEIYAEMRKGTSLSECLRNYPEVFGPLYINVVKIGEATGRLALVFERIANNLKFQEAIKSKTRQALIYPMSVLIVSLLSILFIFDFIVPKFSVIFSDNQRLPDYTQLLLAVSKFVRNYQLHLLLILLGAFILAKHASAKNNTFRKIRDRLVLALPITKGLSLALENLRFSAAMSLLLQSGVALGEAIDLAIASISNTFLRQRLAAVKKEVRAGIRLSESMAKSGFLSSSFDGLLEVGEQTGNLGEIFHEMESRLQNEYENKVQALITLIEPLLIVVMGIIVGSIVIIMLLSIVSVTDVVF